MSELKGCCQIGNFSITPGICAFDPAAIRRSLAQTRRQVRPCRLGVGSMPPTVWANYRRTSA